MSRNRDEKRREREAQQEVEDQARWERIEAVWRVPEYAASEYVDLEDEVGENQAKVIADFIKAMIKGSLDV